MPAPICVKCQVEMRCEKNGQLVNDVRAGQCLPSTYWASDLFACPCCGIEIATGFQNKGTSWLEQRRLGGDVDSSITFASGPGQLEEFADQFEKGDGR